MKPFLCSGSAMDKSLKPIINLCDCTACTVTEELNGIYECNFKLPPNSENAQYLATDGFIIAKPNPTDAPQFFRIYQITKGLNAEIDVNCEHIHYLLNNYICPFNFSTTLQSFLTNLDIRVKSTGLSFPFTLRSDFNHDMDESFIDTIKTIGETLAGSKGSIIDTFGGEWYFENYTAWLMKSRGKNKNVVLQYGYDIVGYSNDISNTESYTHVFPYYLWGLSDGGNAIITLNSQSLTRKYPVLRTGDFLKIDSNYREGKTPPKIYKINLAEIYNIDLSAGYDSFNISSLAENWVNANKSKLIGVNASGKVDFATLQNNIALNKCTIGDTVRVRIPDLEIETQEKIAKTTYDSINEYYTTMDVGEIQQKLENEFISLTQTAQRNTREISKMPSRIISSRE